MKTKQLLVLLPALLLIFLVGCSKDDEIKTLEGTQWKCVGFVDGQNGTIKEIEPKDWKNSYIVSFNSNDSISGRTSSNDFLGRYSADFKTFKIHITYFFITKAGEFGDGDLYWERLVTAQGFSVTKQELKLYYNESNDYLLYNQRN